MEEGMGNELYESDAAIRARENNALFLEQLDRDYPLPSLRLQNTVGRYVGAGQRQSYVHRCSGGIRGLKNSKSVGFR